MSRTVTVGLDGSPESLAAADWAARIRAKLTELLRPWQDKYPGVTVTEQATIGGAGPHLVDASRDAALVVVGRRSRHAPGGSRIGPVTHALLHHAPAPVAVIPHD